MPPSLILRLAPERLIGALELSEQVCEIASPSKTYSMTKLMCVTLWKSNCRTFNLHGLGHSTSALCAVSQNRSPIPSHFFADTGNEESMAITASPAALSQTYLRGLIRLDVLVGSIPAMQITDGLRNVFREYDI